jgi:hypothetical protein
MTRIEITSKPQMNDGGRCSYCGIGGPSCRCFRKSEEAIREASQAWRAVPEELRREVLRLMDYEAFHVHELGETRCSKAGSHAYAAAARLLREIGGDAP